MAEPAKPAAELEHKESEKVVDLQRASSAEDTDIPAEAPDDVVREEEELRKERHKQEAEEAAAHAAEEVQPLDSKRFEALEVLLNQSEMYTKFLSEQMKDIEARTDAEAKGRSAAAGPSGAAKKGAKRGRTGKKKAEDSPEAADDAPGTSAAATTELLPLLKADLRDYQLKGVKWLISLWSNGVNGILADQMGLGKTVQTIGFLSHLKSKGINGPFLVVGPLSTLPNWVNEFERFAPTLPALLYHGSRPEREALRASRLKLGPHGTIPDDYPVIVTSYEIVIADSKFLQKFNFKYLVVDEGHRLKNFNCKLIKELKLIPSANRLLLSGTPLQNNLAELWSLLNFLMPEVFSSLADFESWFDFGSAVSDKGSDKSGLIAAEQRNRVVSKLHSILKPFVLRRMKSDVEIALPRKMEVIMYAGMTETQRKLNTQLLEGTLKEGMHRMASAEGASTAAVGRLNNVLMQMRKNCNHPDLILSQFTTDMNFPTPDEMVRQCGKMQLLDRLLTRLHKRGHKVLIFSQMTSMLDLLQSYLEQHGHRACRIDGSVPWQERQRNIHDFNSDPTTWVFLLSTRAGGLGINLTSADTVIIYDSDWNPHADYQAMDRCHRIGQVKPVLVIRMATAHSVEGKMLRRAASKVALERLVIKKGAFKAEGEQKDEASASASMSATDLMDLLKADFTLDDIPQSGAASDEMVEKLLDRTHLEHPNLPLPYERQGVGYEVVQNDGGQASLLSSI